MECNCEDKILEGHALKHYLCPKHKAALDMNHELHFCRNTFRLIQVGKASAEDISNEIEHITKILAEAEGR